MNKKFSQNFERDYSFYLNNKNILNFAGINIKNEYGIQYPKELEALDENGIAIPFAIPYDITGNNAKTCFYILDSNGKNTPCSEPELLTQILNCKAAVNLQIKMWAQGRAEYTIDNIELQEMMNHYQAPEWVFKAVEKQKDKILKQWIADKLYKKDFYKVAFTLHMSEHSAELTKFITGDWIRISDYVLTWVPRSI